MPAPNPSLAVPCLDRRRLLLLLGSASIPFRALRLRADGVEERIDWIRARYNEIEGARLAVKTVTYEPDDDPLFATLKRYEREGELAKAHLGFSEGDHGAVEETYYYWKGELFFAYVVHASWQFTGRTLANGETETMDTFAEHRLYFSGTNLVRHLIKEVASVNPGEIRGLLAKAQNRPYDDLPLAGEVHRRGLDAASVSDPVSLRRMFD